MVKGYHPKTVDFFLHENVFLNNEYERTETTVPKNRNNEARTMYFKI